MNLLTKVAALAALVATPALASAQRGSAERQAPRPSSTTTTPQPAAAAPATPATAPQLHAASACLVGRNAAVADALFATAPYSNEERTEALRLLGEMQRCAGGARMMSSVPLIRGALAEAVLESRFPTALPARAPALGAKPLLQVELATTRTDAAALAPAYALAECTAVRYQELVRALMASEPASPAASAAFSALSPAFSACVTGNLQLNVDARTLRGVLAEDLYRWSVVQRDGPTSPLAAPAPAGN
jgi:hypothetical protein